MTDLAAIKQPPHSIESEQALLGGLLLDPQAFDRISGKVGDADFYTNDHRRIFRAVSRLMDAAKPVDVVTVAEFLQSHNSLEGVGGLPYLASLASNTPSASNIHHYAEIVRERALMRRLISATNDIGEKVYAGGGLEARELVDYAQAKIMGISEQTIKAKGGAQHVGEVMRGVLQRIDDLHTRDEQSDITGLATGFELLDKMTTGMQPGELIVVAARPSMGKTAFALNVTQHVALELGKRVAFFSLEMANEQLGVRLLSSVATLNQQRVKVGRLYNDEWRQINDAVARLNDAGIYLDEEGSLTANELRSRARVIHRECGGLDLIVVDYLQLMQGSGRTDNRAYEVAEISRGLKMLAKELLCPVMALSQLNRALEQRPNKRPVMSDLRDSGGIEQDADWILFIYRDEVYNPESLDKGIAELIIGKQRNGPTGTVDVNFHAECTRFEHRPRSDIRPSWAARQEKQTSRGSRSGASFRAKNDHAGGDPEF